MDGYRQLLKPTEKTFLDVTLNTCVDALAEVTTEVHQEQWLTAFKLRYLDLQASEDEWRQHKS